MIALPPCPCDERTTLTPTRADVHGFIWCLCALCHRAALVDPDKRIVYRAPDPGPASDVNGVVMFDP